MKRYIKSSKMYNYRLPEEAQAERLKLPGKYMAAKLYDNIDPQDIEVFRYLIDNKVIPTAATSPDLRNNPYYDEEDKLIRLTKSGDGYRVYQVPYAGGGRFGSGNIYSKNIIVHDDGTVEFENVASPKDIHKLSINTLKNYFWKTRY